jgi:hypothetical protein
VPTVWSKQCRSFLPSIATIHDLAFARSEGVYLPVTKEFNKRESETEYLLRNAKALHKIEKD